MGYIPSATAKPTILIVDDTPENIRLLKEILNGTYALRIADSGEKALRIATKPPTPDLILLDIMMPGMDGYTVCRILKSNEATRDIPVIFVTAMEDVANEKKGFEVGAVDYITKPVNPSIVEARVATHLALRFAIRALENQNHVLRENERLRSQVERIIQHDLKAPLTAFLGIPALLKRRKDLPGDVLQIANMLEESGERMMKMLTRSMDLFRMEAGTYQLKPVPVDILRILNQIRFELEKTLRHKEIRLEIEVNGRPVQTEDTFVLPGEESLFYSMLANLIKNAVEATPAKGSILVSCGEGTIPALSIHNPGTIPHEIRRKFMQKYATHGKKGGTGLGGYSARLAAETMGGRIRFRSTEEEGTTIWVEFPPDSPKDTVKGAQEPEEIDKPF